MYSIASKNIDAMTSEITVYVCSLDGLDLGTRTQWGTDWEADRENRIEYNGHGTVFELTVRQDWHAAVRVEI